MSSNEKRDGSSEKRRIVVGVTGASGIPYGARLLEAAEGVAETHLVITEGAEAVMEAGGSADPGDLREAASEVHEPDDMAASIASGSFPVDATVLIPCSMKSLAAVANGMAGNLVTRAADVALKEGRPLVLVPRETPLNDVHLRNMKEVSEAGATVLPASPGFYHGPESVDDMVDFVVGRVLDVLDVPHDLYERWEGE